MGFILLLLESLSAVLLLTAAGVAVAARRRRRWPVFVVVLPAFTAAAFAAFIAWTFHANHNTVSSADVLEVEWSAWALLTAVGTLAVTIRGVRTAGEPQQPAARQWPALRLALSGVAGVVLFVATLWTMTNAFMARVAALRAEAGSLALAAAPARLPDHENAAPLYEAAAELLRESPDDQARLNRWLAADTLGPNDLPEAMAFLARRAAGLGLVGRATTLPGCQFDSSPSQVLGTNEGVGYVRRAMPVMALQARTLAAGKNTSEVIGHTLPMLRMASHVAGNPDVMANLTAAALESQALATLDKVLVHGTFPAPAVDAGIFDLTVPPILYRYYLRRALQAEEALVYGRLAGIVEQATGFGLMYLDDELAANHALFRRMADELAKPYPECLRGWDGIEAEFKDIPGVLYRLAAQAYARMLPAAARADASRRVAQFAVAVAAYRADEGKFPARAEDVVPKYLPQVPPDPFTGEPLKLKATADGVVVYSVGPDGVDDGGQPLNGEHPPKGDIRVRIGERK